MAATDSPKQIDYMMQEQQQSNWCWAACGASTGNFYSGGDNYTQCEIANTCQGKTSCCTDPAGCNFYGYLDTALEAAQCFDRKQSSPVDFPTVKASIDANRPLGARVKWNGGGAHFLMMTGYGTGTGTPPAPTIVVDDPAYGRSSIAFSRYAAHYHAGGTWTHSYFTKSAQGAGS